jgi:hypothetical protein
LVVLFFLYLGGHELRLKLLEGDWLRGAPLLLDLLCQQVGQDGGCRRVVLDQADGNASAVLGIHAVLSPGPVLQQVDHDGLCVGQGVLHEVVAGDVAPLLLGKRHGVLANEQVVQLINPAEAGLLLLEGHAEPLGHGNALAAPAANEAVELTVEEEACIGVIVIVLVLVLVLLLLVLLLIGDVLHGAHHLAAARAGALVVRVQKPGGDAGVVEGVLAGERSASRDGHINLVKANSAGRHFRLFGGGLPFSEPACSIFLKEAPYGILWCPMVPYGIL